MNRDEYNEAIANCYGEIEYIQIRISIYRKCERLYKRAQDLFKAGKEAKNQITMRIAKKAIDELRKQDEAVGLDGLFVDPETIEEEMDKELRKENAKANKRRYG